MLVTVVGPNLRDQSKGDFHVHEASCGDLKRDPNMKNAEHYTLNALSREDVSTIIYSDFENPESFVDTFHFAPCTKELPNA